MKTKIWLISIIVFIIDQITKQIVNSSILYGDSIKIIKNFFYLTHAQNKGAAFSILQGKTFMFIIIAVFFLLYLFKIIKEEKKLSRLNIISYGLLIGGIIGNLTDRIVYGYVVDFFDFKIFNYAFPIFNIADMAMVIGTIIMIYIIIREWWNNARNNS